MINKTRNSINLLLIFIGAFLVLSSIVLVVYNLQAVSEDKLYDDYNTKSSIDTTNQNIMTTGLGIVSNLKVIFIAIIGGIVILVFLISRKDGILPFFQKILSRFP